jgi:hypothetical protein
MIAQFLGIPKSLIIRAERWIKVPLFKGDLGGSKR